MVDVLSVKEFPKKLLLRTVPDEFDILCTHPMFGPDSGKGSWENLPMMFEKVRIGSKTESNEERCVNFLRIFEHEGCRMIPMSCEEHDRQAASTQFITHTVGRMLGDMKVSVHTHTGSYHSAALLRLLRADHDNFRRFLLHHPPKQNNSAGVHSDQHQGLRVPSYFD